MRRVVLTVAASLLLASCASRAANVNPDPHVVILASDPSGAALELRCAGETSHHTTPVRIEVPPRDEYCDAELTMAGYRPARLRLDGYLVLTKGEPLHADEHHELDPSRATPVDVVLFPLQKLGDRMQNWLMRRVTADYRLTVALLRAE